MQTKDINTVEYSVVRLTLVKTGSRHSTLSYELPGHSVKILANGTTASMQKMFDKMSSGRLTNMLRGKNE